MTKREGSAAGHYLDKVVHEILDENGIYSKEFNTGQAPEQAEEGRGSQMVKDDQAQNNSRPPADMAQEADRESFNERWSQEQQNADDELDYEQER